MKRPAHWIDLPFPLKESMVEMAELCYDHYESSNAEAKEKVLAETKISGQNVGKVQEVYCRVSDDGLISIANEELEKLEMAQREIQKFIDAE